MGIFNTIFGNSKEGSEKETKNNIQWIPLTSSSQLEEIKQFSIKASVFLFKHSTRCGISKVVIKQFENLFKEEHQNLKVYYLDLLNYRDISNEIAETFEVTHQSPQVIVVKNGFSVFNTSHNDITLIDLARFV
ncbi:bacillithiol system redox-active protein YtxJ [Polaribacter sp.]|uniref:bacillithiol system redox-active protein YtxJ n=1 Tax=Polaribacter sp. TaxID=1920175 RepID=UPI0025DEC362|nr:bacillithiol system redox-active protein YtxJ [Polaribacter sp.]